MVDFLPLGISPNQFINKKKYTGDLLIVGSSRGVWEELEKYQNDGVYYRVPDVMCLNDMIMHFPGRVVHAYSNDYKWLPRWVSARRPRFVKDLEESIQLHSCNGPSPWPWPGHGSSGLNAIYTGLALGYDQITVAGVPLDDSGHYFDPPWKKTNFTKEVPDKYGEVKYWQFSINEIFKGKVKSLSNIRSLQWT